MRASATKSGHSRGSKKPTSSERAGWSGSTSTPPWRSSAPTRASTICCAASGCPRRAPEARPDDTWSVVIVFEGARVLVVVAGSDDLLARDARHQMRPVLDGLAERFQFDVRD